MYNTDIEYIGKKIRDYRKAKNMSMQELGDAIGKSKATIAKYENNDILVDMLTVLEICNVFNVDINDLCERTVKDVENIKTKNPFNCSLLYLYYISKNGLVLSSIEIEEKEYANYKIGLRNKIASNINFATVTGDGNCVISFKLDSSGNLINRAFSQQSNNDSLNDAVYSAMMQTPSYRTPPAAYKNQTLKLSVKMYGGSFEVDLN